MRISIFGLGYVGSVSAACLAHSGHEVIGIDNNKTKVDMLNAGKSLIVEPDLHEITTKSMKEGRLRATSDTVDAIENSDLSFICVGTPSQKNNSLDLQYVKKVCEDIGNALKNKASFHTIACRSTMFPGSMRKVVIPLLEKFSGKTNEKDFSVCINPEFMKEGTAVYDFFHPPKNIVGSEDAHARDVLINLNATFTKVPTICLNIEEAEFIKYCDNVWHALKVSFANEIGNVCDRLSLDSHNIMDVFCKDTTLNISPYYLKPGFAFGGSCLPKDLRAFLYESQNLNLDLPLIKSVLPSNKLQIDKAFKMIVERRNRQVGILGFSFKENTDDLRESPMVELIERLLGKGYSLKIYDKNVNAALLHGSNREYLTTHIPHISQLMVTDIEEVLLTSKTIVIGNRSKEFENIVNRINDTQTVIDLVRITKAIPTSKQYKGICW